MTVEIVKVQVPLAGSHLHLSSGRGLVYAAERSRMCEQAISDETRAALGADPKGYFEARWTDSGAWEIGKRVAAQDW